MMTDVAGRASTGKRDPARGATRARGRTHAAPATGEHQNRYAYGWNNPFSWVDPFGLENESSGDFPETPPQTGDVQFPIETITGTGPAESGAPRETLDPLAETAFPAAPGPTETGAPMPLAPPVSPGVPPDAASIQKILEDAMQDPNCVLASCGESPAEFAFRNTSNALNQPPPDEVAAQQARWRAKVDDFARHPEREALEPVLTPGQIAMLVPPIRGGTLAVEAVDLLAEGHTITKHVGLSVAALDARLAAETNLRMASTFTTEAEAVGAAALRCRRTVHT